MEQQQTVVVPERFRGPPQSGNGGYVCGLMLDALGTGSGEVTLRAPTPLDTPMTLERDGDRGVRLTHDETLIAEAVEATLALEVPPMPPRDRVLAARRRSPSFWSRPSAQVVAGTGVHPICFCCGADLAAEDGLHIYAAPVSEGLVAAAWSVPRRYCDDRGRLGVEHVCAALDCPGQFAWYEHGPDGVRNGALLGRFRVRVDAPVHAAERCTILGWRLGDAGRKFYAGTALYGEDGTVRAAACATWIRMRPASADGG